MGIGRCQSRRSELDDVVLLQRPGIIGKVRRAGPDGSRRQISVTHDVFVMHQLEAGDAAPGVAERLDKGPSAGGGRVHAGVKARRLGLVGIVGDANSDACLGALAQGRGDDGGERGAKAEVLDGDIERALGAMRKAARRVAVSVGGCSCSARKEAWRSPGWSKGACVIVLFLSCAAWPGAGGRRHSCAGDQ